ncbi:cation:proton antiporter [Thermogemmatispora sp.]|uniref:cation:proton antiporter n=1 Tax=Thermogemmatispora sp. TaxID=1968838 RepID=UPI0035E45B0B
MLENLWFIAATWMALALFASLISIRTGVSVALVEIVLGVIGGNSHLLHTTAWSDFLASLGSVLLTFLAGAEIEPAAFRRHLWPSLLIGSLSFLIPFIGAFSFTFFVSHWSWRAAELAGIALSTTSVAVVYAVMVETGLNRREIGKLILAACFVTDLGTVLALGLLFAGFTLWMLAFVVATALLLWRLPALTGWLFHYLGGRVSEFEVKLLLLVLFALGGLASLAGSEAVLPAYLVGLVMAGSFEHERILMQRLRSLAFALLTPFFFLKAGMYISLPALLSGALLIICLFTVKIGTKFLGVMPLTRAFHLPAREGTYTTLLMATGLTFGSISSLYGLTHHIIGQSQYTVLVSVVILSAFVPTLIAQTWFLPRFEALPATEDEPALETVESEQEADA